MQEKRKRKTVNRKSNRQKMFFLLTLISLLLVLVVILLPPRGGKPGPEYPEIAPTADSRLAEPVLTPRPTRRESQSGALPPAPEGRGRLALVIDDAGNSLADLQPFIRAELKLTIAVLPGLAYSAESARLAQNRGKEVILHQPLEAVNGNALGPGGILTTDSPEVILETLDTNFASIPGLKGMNNHMGSLGTADPRVMDILMGFLAKQGIFFLDSRTTARTVAGEYAGGHGVPFASRDVFLDNVVEREAISARLEEGAHLALERGSAILIGHVHNNLVMEVVNAAFAGLEKRGLEFVFLSELVAH